MYPSTLVYWDFIFTRIPNKAPKITIPPWAIHNSYRRDGLKVSLSKSKIIAVVTMPIAKLNPNTTPNGISTDSAQKKRKETGVAF